MKAAGKLNGIATLMAFLLTAVALGAVIGVQPAHAAAMTDFSDYYKTNVTVNTMANSSGTDPQAGLDLSNADDMKKYQERVAATTVVPTVGRVIINSSNKIEILVNPQATSSKPVDSTIVVNVNVNGKPTAVPTTDWTYNKNNGVLTINKLPDGTKTNDSKHQIKGLAVYSYIKKSQLVSSSDINFYARQKIDSGSGYAVANFEKTTASLDWTPATADESSTRIANIESGVTKVYKVEIDDNTPKRTSYGTWNAAFVEMPSVKNSGGYGYASYTIDDLVLYSVTLKDGKISKSALIPKSVYTITSEGNIVFPEQSNIANVVAISTTTKKTELVPASLSNRTGTKIELRQAAGQQYRYSSDGGKTWGDWKSSAVFTGLENDTKYYFQTRFSGDTDSDNWSKIYQFRTLRTETAPEPWQPEYTEGKTYWGTSTPYNHYDFNGGVDTMFYVHMNDDFKDDNGNAAFWCGMDPVMALCITHGAMWTDVAGETNLSTAVTCTGIDYTNRTYTFTITGYSNGNQSYQGTIDGGQPAPMSIEISKAFENEDKIAKAENHTYSLEGAQYKVTKEDGSEVSGSPIETDGDGRAKIEGLEAGTYYIQEIRSSDGCAVNGERIRVSGSAGEDLSFGANDGFTEPELVGDPFELIKYDTTMAELAKNNSDIKGDGSTPQGNAEVSDIIFEIRLIGEHDLTVAQAAQATPVSKWFLKTTYEHPDESHGNQTPYTATAKFDNTHKVNSVTVDGSRKTSDDFYKLDGKIICPTGTYIVRELTPTGYNNDYASTDSGWKMFDYDGPTSSGNDYHESETRKYPIETGPGTNKYKNAFGNATEWYNTVWRGDIELIKADDTFRTHETGRTNGKAHDPQGNATFEGAIYSIVNRSVHAVISPEDGKTVVKPGAVVCHIATDATGKASTKNPHYNASTGKYTATGGWSTPNKWNGALAYGDYEAFEINAPVGYMLGHYNNDAVTYYSMRTTNSNHASNTNTSVLEGITAAAAKSFGFANENNRNTFVAGSTIKKIVPSSTTKWVDADKSLVSFTERGNAIPADLRNNTDIGDKWSEDTVKRGDIELIKADDTLKTYNQHRTTTASFDDDAQGDATLAGASYAIVNRSERAVQSPQNNEVVQPGAVVCVIKTDSTGKASTRNAAANGWSIPDGWRAALAYGDYEVFETEAPVGYMLGHWEGLDVTYYSLCTDGSDYHGADTPLLNASNAVGFNTVNGNDYSSKKFGFSKVVGVRSDSYVNNQYVREANVVRHVADASSQKWINDDKVTVTFDTRVNPITADVASVWTEDTVKRADIELHKADDTLNTTESNGIVVDYAGRTKPEGDASLTDAKFAIINRSEQAVVAPSGALIQPGKIVCFIYTDENGYASTKLTDDRIKRNRWDQATTTAVNGLTYGKNGTAPDGKGVIYAQAKKWHGALAYGEYEVFEVTEPEGYLNGHWFQNYDENGNPTTDVQTKWAAMALKGENVGAKTSIAGSDDVRAQVPEAYVNDSETVEWYEIYPRVDDFYKHTWIEVDNLEWYEEAGYGTGQYPSKDEFADEDSFTRDALLNGSSHKSSLDSYKNNATIKKEQRFEDTPMRGDLDLQKVDDDFMSEENGEIKNTIEDGTSNDAVVTTDPANPYLDGKNPITITNGRGHLEGAVFGVYNRSKTVVVSPMTGQEIWPVGADIPGTNLKSDGLVCTIITDEFGYASTALTPEVIRYNEWDRQYNNGIKDYANGRCWATEQGWHAALAYGEYEVVEITPPTGYLLNKEWHGMATKGTTSDGGAVTEYYDAETQAAISTSNEIHAAVDSDYANNGYNAESLLKGKGVSVSNAREVKANGSKNWSLPKHGYVDVSGNLSDNKFAPAMTNEHTYNGNVSNVRSTWTAKSQSTWINEDRVLVCFGTMQADHFEQGQVASSRGNSGTENLNASTVEKSKKTSNRDAASTSSTATNTKQDNDAVWVQDEIIRGGVKLGKVDRQNQQYKAQGKASLENTIIGIFSTNPNPVTVYQMDEANKLFADEEGSARQVTVDGVTMTTYYNKSGVEANASGLYNSKYQDKRDDGKVSWTYPGWIYKDSAQDYESIPNNGAWNTLGFSNQNSDPYYPGVYYYWPTKGLPEFGKQTADGVFVGYITTKALKDGDIDKIIAQTDNDTLPYGTYTLREMYVPDDSGYMFDEVSMSWHETFGIGDDFAYVEHDLNGKYRGNDDYYGGYSNSIAGSGYDEYWYKDESVDKNGWYDHEKDYRFIEAYKQNNGAPDTVRNMPLYYYTATSDLSKVFSNKESEYYLPGAYHNSYVEARGDSTPATTVPIDGEYFHRTVPTNAHDEEHYNNQIVDFTDDAKLCVSNYVRRGDLYFYKYDLDNNPLIGVPFAVTSKTTGETHIVVTNENGVYDSRQAESTSQILSVTTPKRAHWYHTDENDHALTKQRNEVTNIPYIKIGTDGELEDINTVATFDTDGYWYDEGTDDNIPALDWEYGLWFNGRVDAITTHAQRDASGRDMQYDLNHNGYVSYDRWSTPYNTHKTSEKTKTAASNQLASLDNPDWYIDNPSTIPYWHSSSGTISIFRSPVGALPFDDYVIQELPIKERKVTVGDTNPQTFTCIDNSKFMMVGDTNFSIDHMADVASSEYVYGGFYGGIVFTSFNHIANVEVGLKTLHLFDKEPRIGTTLSSSAETEKKYGEPGTSVKLYDKVSYTDVEADHEYYLIGKLYNVAKTTVGEGDEAVVTYATIGDPIQEVRSDVFKTNNTVGEFTVEFNFDASAMEGANVVAYEYLFDASTNQRVAKHEDPADKGQTVSFPTIGTQLGETGDTEKYAPVYKKITLVDTIAYHGLIPGSAYIATGTLMTVDDNGNATEAVDASGKTITAEQGFVADAADGSIQVPFTFEVPDLAGKKLVAYEELYEGKQNFTVKGELVAEHKDPKDPDQTVYAPSIHTNAIDANTGEHVGLADGNITIEDEVTYTNLIYGQEYVMEGTLMDKATGKEFVTADGKTISSKATFIAGGDDAVREPVKYAYVNEAGETIEVAKESDVPEGVTAVKVDPSVHKRASGTVVITFELGSIEGIAGHSLVVFEQATPVYPTEPDGRDYPDNPKPVAVHEDIDDEGQTIDYPDLHTNATDGITNTHEGLAEGTVTINDLVTYTNLVKGNSYTLTGTLMDKTTGEELKGSDGKAITSEAAFIAGEEQEDVAAGTRVSGTVMMKFEVPGELLVGKKVVVFENLYYQGKLIGVHADIEDEDQTVNYPKIGTTLTTGNDYLKTDFARDNQFLVDKISYEGLTPGVKYIASGVIMRKDTGERALDSDGNEIFGTTEFTPERPNGVVYVTFEASIKNLSYVDIVAFETMQRESDVADELVVVAKHEDINDEGQTVKLNDVYSEPITTGMFQMQRASEPIASTGDMLPLVIIIVLVAGGAAGAIAYGVRRRRR